MIDQKNSLDEAKKAAGQKAAELVENGMLVGLGTGSTATYFIKALAQRCLEGLKISATASSQQSLHLAQQLGIPLISDQQITHLDLTVDGADEIDSRKNMIKGGGGALLREKLLASSSREMIVIIDEHKLVQRLGHFPLPVEISAFAYKTTLQRLESNGYQGKLRLQEDGSLFITDNGNYIFDIQFPHLILHPEKEHEQLNRLTGVIENGLFLNIAGRVIIGYRNGTVQIQS